VDELRILVANLMEKALLVADIDGEVGCAANAGVVGCASCSKLFVMDTQAYMSVLGSSLWPSPDSTMEALRCLVNDFLAKVRAEVDRILFFGLVLKVDASSAIKRRMGRVFSQLGLKPKLLFGFKWRRRRRPLAVLSRFKKNADVVRVPNSFSGQGEGEEEASSEALVVSALQSEVDGSDEISVLPASSPTSSVSLPSPVSSPTSPASQPSSLAFAGSSDELGSLSVTQTQTPSLEPSSFIDFSEGSESVSASDLPIPEAQLLVNGLTKAHAWYLGWLRDGSRSHEMLAVIDRFEVQTRRKNEVAPPPVCSMELPQLKATLEVVTIKRETVVRSLARI
jgi:hypothetical protein